MVASAQTAARATAKRTSGTITGAVTDQAGKPIAGAHVKLTGNGQSFTAVILVVVRIKHTPVTERASCDRRPLCCYRARG